MPVRNPYAPREALTLADLKPGMKVVVIKGGGAHHEPLIITSSPYSHYYETQGHRRDVTVRARAMCVMAQVPVHPGERPNEPQPRFLSDMGITSDRDGRWNFYTVTLEQYLQNNGRYS